MANYDILGDIAIVKFEDSVSMEEKIVKAKQLMKDYKCIKTVLEKTNKVSGRLRTIKTKFLIGENKKEALYKENGCLFKLNIDSCYFSPRLANERLEVAKFIVKYSEKNKIKNPSIIVMFAGVAPFSIIIAKALGNKSGKIVSMELGKECNKYAKENVLLNKTKNIEVIGGDVKKIIPKLFERNKKEKYNFIVMARPNLKETFLKQGLMMAKKNSIIIYYGFSPESKEKEMLSELEKEARFLKRKIKILNCFEAGDIAPFEHRYRIEIKVLN
jgi:tRNA (guanine37-N1)-methyltransferase